MAEDTSVFLIGEDIDRSVSGATRGLIDEFGSDRVRNAPISEAAIAGACVGAAMAGLRPVADLMYGSFLYLGMDQIANQAARWHYMSGGQVELPIVYMAQMGPSSSAAAQHSESPHAMFMHVAGIKVVIPSNPRDAKGLMLGAIRDPNPVLFLRDAALGGTRGDVPAEPYATELGRAGVMREGADVTLVAIASTVPRALAAADSLEDQCSIEVIDPRTLVPLDLETIVRSVSKTGRLIVCDNARRTCGAGSEIVTRVLERAFGELKATPLVLTTPDVPIPFAPELEQAVLVSQAAIEDAVQQVMRG
jgi:pyruvate dehydrogenase E1 component beta subunit